VADVIMPKMGDAMTEGKVLSWRKKVGDQVSKGEPIAEIETDKSTVEMEATATGTLAEIVHEADLKDQKFARDEARGIDLALRGLLSAIKDDQEALAHGLTLFDGLYATIGERA